MALENEKIEEVLKKLPAKLHDEVLKFAESLLLGQRARDAGNVAENRTASVRSFFGSWDSGDPRSGDSDRIDFDLGPRICGLPH